MSDWPSAESLHPFIGQWVAVQDGSVAYAANTAKELVELLRSLGERADAVFQVPVDPTQDTHK